jgi:hypothetical protein
MKQNIMQYKMKNGTYETVYTDASNKKLDRKMVLLTAKAHIGENWVDCILSDGNGTIYDRMANTN